MGITTHSKLLSYILRHRPENYNVTLDKNGWAYIDEIGAVPALTRERLEQIVRLDKKGRYQISQDGKRIRAVQGHSTPQVKMEFTPTRPPAVLFHGTSQAAVVTILATGIKPMNRHHVHLSEQHETALQVGARHGSPVVFQIDTRAMEAAGYAFYKAVNGVWLCDAVPAKFITLVRHK